MPSRFDVLPLKTVTKLVLDVDTETVASITAQERPAQVLNDLVKQRIFVVEDDTLASMRRYVLQARKVGSAKTVVEAYGYLYSQPSTQDVRMSAVAMSVDPVSTDRRYDMNVHLQWPEVDAAAAAFFATTQMRQFARQLPAHSGFGDRMLRQLLYTRAQRSTGMVVQTNDMGSCSIEADRKDYTDVPDIELGAHNLYTHEQQLICLVGATAFAYADTHF
ncbi:MAG: hypothetical protein WAQ24_02940 [Candidatus Saccharimonadales bacterium]